MTGGMGARGTDMQAEILVPRAASPFSGASGLYTYAVPEELAPALSPGQLVSVPFGDRTTAGLVWALDATDPQDPETLRAVAAIVHAEPLLLPPQRALAEWMADHYAAPLASVVRLLLPPGLLRGLRAWLRPVARVTTAAEAAGATPEEAIVLAMLRERGGVDRRELERILGRVRARNVIASLQARGAIEQAVELPGTLAGSRRERLVRLTGTPEALATWREAARQRLDALPAAPMRRPPRSPARRDERQAERLLRQLAVLDVLSRAPQAGVTPAPEAWRLEELRSLTRVTESGLSELAAHALIRIDEVEVRHDPHGGRILAPSAPLPLTSEQQAALRAILAAAGPAASHVDHPPVFVLHGITGSGKTEVYLQALAALVARGRRGLVLVPEIALTPQAVARFGARFPGRVALLHSGLSDAERLSEWRRIRSGAADIVVGSRSALFAPIDRLGLIVVDEEHEAAYKEEHTPTYHAREVATRLGALTGAPVILGSATPSVETYWLATQGVYRLLELRQRATAPVAPAAGTPTAADSGGERELPGDGLPRVGVVDLRAELRAGNTSILSQTLRTALQETLQRGEQALLFLNRRGTASAVVCRECGYVLRCGRCDVSMTFHAGERAVICHYCGRSEHAPQVCPACWSASIRYFGIGTERVEAAVKRQFPAARVLRWDRDTARTRQAHEELLAAFAERRADVLVGTQMIAKGLDLPGVTLVGVVSADVALFLPDFRASERAFQLLTQVAGGGGGGETPGQVLVQTFNPEHFCIQAAARHDYHDFYAAEIAARERYGYPPLRRFVKCTYEHRDRYTAQIETSVLAERLERLIRELDLPETDVVGPAPAFLERLRGRYRWHLIVRSPDPRPLVRALTPDDLRHGWSVDVDPTSSL
jgi:primosomal protein N' (replication factor Y)